MSDVADRLRRLAGGCKGDPYGEAYEDDLLAAADEIGRLEAEVDRLREERHALRNWLGEIALVVAEKAAAARAMARKGASDG